MTTTLNALFPLQTIRSRNRIATIFLTINQFCTRPETKNNLSHTQKAFQDIVVEAWNILTFISVIIRHATGCMLCNS